MQVPSKTRKKRRLGQSENGIARRKASKPNEVWSYDFLFDVTERGQTLKMMPILDEYTRECLALVVATSITAKDVVAELEKLFAERGLPEHIRSDNGPEYIAQEVKGFLANNEIKPLFIEPGSPWENGYSESFNSRFREECLNQELMYNVREARLIAEEYRLFYNTERLHSALNYETPEAFARNWESNVSTLH